jgi:hypothetical protein
MTSRQPLDDSSTGEKMKFTREANNFIISNTRTFVSKNERNVALTATLAQLAQLRVIEKFCTNKSAIKSCTKSMRKIVKDLVRN